MRLSRFLIVGLAALLVTVSPVDAQQNPAKLSRRMTANLNQKEKRRASFNEVVFSDAEESVLKGSQGETLEGLSRLLGGRSVHEVERRCVELGLRCGAGASAPPKNSEKWRARARRE